MSLIMQQISPENLQLPMLRNLHVELQRVVRKATEKKIEHRYASATEFGDALEQVAMYLGTSGQRISAALPMPSLIRHATGNFAQSDLLPGHLLPDSQETRPHIPAFVPRQNQQQQLAENTVQVQKTPQPGQHHFPTHQQDDSFLGLAVADLPPPPINSVNKFASEIIEQASDSSASQTPNLVEQKSLTSFSTQIAILIAVSILAFISTYFAFLFLGIIVNHFLDSGAKLVTTILITLAIPALTILSESSRKEQFEVIIQPAERVRRVAWMTTLFSGLVVLMISLLMPGSVIRELRGNPNWFLRTSDAVTSEPGKISSLNRNISFSLASSVEVTTRTLGLYDENPVKKDTPAQTFRTGPPPSTRPGNSNKSSEPADSAEPTALAHESPSDTHNTESVPDKTSEPSKTTIVSPVKKRSSPVAPTRPQKPVDEDYIRW